MLTQVAAIITSHYLWEFWVNKKRKEQHRQIKVVDKSLLVLRLGGIILLLVLYLSFRSKSTTLFSLSTSWKLIGLVLSSYGLYLFNSSHYYLAENWTPIVAQVDNHKLIKDGPYKYVRHPMYTSMLSFFIGITLMTGAIPAIVFLLAACAISIYRVPVEDKLMASMFKSEHASWKKNTFAVLPPIW